MTGQTRQDNIDKLTQELINLGAKLIVCGPFQPYELKSKYGAPELETGHSAYRMIILPDGATDTSDSSSTRF